MINLTIKGDKYQIPESIKEIKLSKYIDFLYFVDANEPKVLKELRTIAESEAYRERMEKMTKGEEKQFLQYIHKEVAFWGDIPYLLIRKCDRRDVELVWSILQNNLGVREDVSFNCFELQGDIYYMPKRMMQDSTFEDYTEACSYEEALSEVHNGVYQALFYVAAIVSRKEKSSGERESFDDYNQEERAEFFKQHLSAYDAFQIGFFLRRLSEQSLTDFQIFTAASTLSRLKLVTNN